MTRQHTSRSRRADIGKGDRHDLARTGAAFLRSERLGTERGQRRATPENDVVTSVLPPKIAVVQRTVDPSTDTSMLFVRTGLSIFTESRPITSRAS